MLQSQISPSEDLTPPSSPPKLSYALDTLYTEEDEQPQDDLTLHTLKLEEEVLLLKRRLDTLKKEKEKHVDDLRRLERGGPSLETKSVVDDADGEDRLEEALRVAKRELSRVQEHVAKLRNEVHQPDLVRTSLDRPSLESTEVIPTVVLPTNDLR